MSEQRVRLVSYKRESSAVFMPERFEFNPKGRLPWLQKLIFGVLRKLKADSFDMAVTYKTIDIDTSKIVEAIMKNQRDVEMLYYKRAKYLVMGPTDFAKMSNEPEMREMQRFHFTTKIGMGREITALGLEVVIVPWIEGFFVLPELTGDSLRF